MCVLDSCNNCFSTVSFIHSISAHCGARPNSIAQRTVSSEINNIRFDMGLESYPEPVGLKVGDVQFRLVDLYYEI